jgi:hypothetical protein
MSTLSLDPRAGATPRQPTVDPAAAVAGARPRTTVRETISQALSMAWRSLK